MSNSIVHSKNNVVNLGSESPVDRPRSSPPTLPHEPQNGGKGSTMVRKREERADVMETTNEIPTGGERPRAEVMTQSVKLIRRDHNPPER